MSKPKKEDVEYEDVYEDEEEYEDDEDGMPSCCVACGGPYPSCMSSCSIFDD